MLGWRLAKKQLHGKILKCCISCENFSAVILLMLDRLLEFEISAQKVDPQEIKW